MDETLDTNILLELKQVSKTHNTRHTRLYSTIDL